VALRGITVDELSTFPKGYVIIKILRRMGLLH
jgi:hypothetical protein